MRTHAPRPGLRRHQLPDPRAGRQRAAYRKGPYYAAEGDFASAGALHLDATPTGWRRTSLRSSSAASATGAPCRRVRCRSARPAPCSRAGEIVRYDGPWERPTTLRKLNGVLRYSAGHADNGFAVTAMAYSGPGTRPTRSRSAPWSTGSIGRFGALDPTDGGDAQRYSLSARWHETDAESATRRSNAYVVTSDARTSSTTSPTSSTTRSTATSSSRPTSASIARRQRRARRTSAPASAASRARPRIGVQIALRRHRRRPVQHRAARRPVDGARRPGRARPASASTPRTRCSWTPGCAPRSACAPTCYWADVASDLAANSGSDLDAFLASPKAGLVFGPVGQDRALSQRRHRLSQQRRARRRHDRRSDRRVTPVAAGRRCWCARAAPRSGVRTQPVKDLEHLRACSCSTSTPRSVFVGDAGTTEASRPSRRIGAEYTLRSQLTPWLCARLRPAYTQARFTEDDPATPGRYIPGATEGVVSAGADFDNVRGGWFGGAALALLRAAAADRGQQRALEADLACVNARLGYKFADGLIVRVDGFNLFNAQAHQIDYYYASRLRGRAAARSTTSTSIRSSRAPSACRCARSFDGVDVPVALQRHPCAGGDQRKYPCRVDGAISAWREDPPARA